MRMRSIAFCVALAALLLAAADLKIHTINVGRGGSPLVRGANGTTVLLEAGRAGEGSGSAVPYLQSTCTRWVRVEKVS